MKHRTMFTLSLVCLGLLLIACGGGTDGPEPEPDTPASISGTLFFPGYLGDVDVSASNVEIVPGDVFVQFAPGINTQSVSTLKVADTSFKFASTAANDRLGIYRAEGISAEETWQLIARLAASPEVIDAFPNQIFRVQQDDPECIDNPNLAGCEDGVLDDEEYCAAFPEDVDFCGSQNPGNENPGGEQDPECIDNPNLAGCEDGVLDDEEYCAAFPEDVDFCGPPNPGGENPGGENPGGENPDGENPGGENPGGENPGGETPIPDGEKRPNDGSYALQWHYDAFNLPRAWQIEDGTSNEIVVAVLDTGIAQHPDIVENLLPGYNFIEENNDPTDDGINTDFHGLHVAGTVAARTNNTRGIAGVSWGAKIVPVRVLGADGGSTQQILDGIEWAAKTQRAQAQLPANPNPQAKVINLSLGGPGECSAAIEELFADIARSGTIIVAAAGNENVDVSTSWPGNCQHVLTVGATGPTNQRAPYSNYGTG
ncbi:MAG: S8 family serine peptidase, partial [Deinococcota bacterium]